MRWLIVSSAAALGAAVSLGLCARPAHAKPEYARREGKSCSYCHVNPRGGGARNYRGDYYRGAGYTFARFDDAAEAKRAGVAIGPDASPPPRSYVPPAAPPAPVVAPPPAVATPSAVTAPAPATVPEDTTADTGTAVSRATAKVNATRGAYQKKPTAAAKKAYAQALAELGHAIWTTGTVTAERRTEALNLYKRALALDPANKMATSEKRKLMAKKT